MSIDRLYVSTKPKPSQGLKLHKGRYISVSAFCLNQTQTLSGIETVAEVVGRSGEEGGLNQTQTLSGIETWNKRRWKSAKSAGGSQPNPNPLRD